MLGSLKHPRLPRRFSSNFMNGPLSDYKRLKHRDEEGVAVLKSKEKRDVSSFMNEQPLIYSNWKNLQWNPAHIFMTHCINLLRKAQH